jgi:hypothetical protein
MVVDRRGRSRARPLLLYLVYEGKSLKKLSSRCELSGQHRCQLSLFTDARVRSGVMRGRRLIGVGGLGLAAQQPRLLLLAEPMAVPFDVDGT